MLNQKRPPNLGAVIEKTVELPAMPTIANKVLEQVNHPDASVPKIAQMIQADQVITANILRMSNSSFYGLKRQVTSLQQAIMILGLREVKNLVIAFATRSMFKRFDALEQEMWRHSIACGLASQSIAQKVSLEMRELAFIAGQLHDLGKVIMNNHDRKRYADVDLRRKDEPIIDVEQSVFGFTHTDVGGLLMQRWDMPEPLETTASYHHDIALASSLAEAQAPLVACIVLGDAICHRFGIGAPQRSDEEWLGAETLGALELLGIDEERADVWSKEFFEGFSKEAANLL